MFREECYYLTKFLMVSEIDIPECNQNEPRVDEQYVKKISNKLNQDNAKSINKLLEKRDKNS